MGTAGTFVRWRAVSVMALVIVTIAPMARAGADPASNRTFDTYVASPPMGVDDTQSAVAVADLTGDGVADIATAGAWTRGGRLRIFPGLGDGTFGSPDVHPLLRGSNSVAAGDLNGDGRIDLAATAGSQVELFLQTPTGAMTPAGILQLEADKARIADLTGDGRADLVVLGWDTDAVVVYPQSPGGALGAPVTYVVPLGGFNDLEVADLNGDGRTDVVAMSGQMSNPNLSVLLQQPSGTLLVRGSYSVPGPFTLTHGIGVGDVDGDGLAEVVLDYYYGETQTPKITVFEAATDGSLTAGVALTVTNGAEPVEVADVNADGFADAVIAHGGWQTVSVLYGSSHGLTLPAEVMPVPDASHYNPHGLAVADLDGDGHPEIVLAYNRNFLFFPNRTPDADVHLSLASSMSSAKVGYAVSQTLTVKNEGTVAITGQVRLQIPSQFKVQRWSDPHCSYSNNSLDCPVPRLPLGGTYTVSTILRAYTPGVAQTDATLLTSSPQDGDGSDNSASVTVTIKASQTDGRIRAALDQMVQRGQLR